MSAERRWRSAAGGPAGELGRAGLQAGGARGVFGRGGRRRRSAARRRCPPALRAIGAANPGKRDGLFGDAHCTNKERLPDSTLNNLGEHLSTVVLSLANVREDELGNGYELLIKKFADDSGHTAQEFYTNRAIVRLMAQLLDPKPGERIHDPTRGTGGMLTAL